MNLVERYMPWLFEPDYTSYKIKDLHCIIKRGPSTSLCGYIGIPITKDPYKNLIPMENWHEELRVHGGITFTESSRISMHRMFPEFRYTRKLLWIGFDCSHYQDLLPLTFMEFGRREGQYRTIDYVKREIEKLAEQIIKVANES